MEENSAKPKERIPGAKIKVLLFLLGSIFYITACGDRPYYEEYVKIPGEGWQADSSIVFNVRIEDTAVDFNIFLNLRHNSSYPYSNIYFFREIRSDRGLEFRDTIEYRMADAYGKWLGTGIGELKTLQWPYTPRAANFRKKGVYDFIITQAMREENLKGIEDVGITIFKSKSEKE